MAANTRMNFPPAIGGGGGMRFSRKFDLAVITILAFTLCIVLYMEYDINVLNWLKDYIFYLLDPQIQTVDNQRHSYQHRNVL
jgi:hypothetical protein